MSLSESRWAIGVLCSLLGSLFSALGTVLQKYAHMKNDELPLEKRRSIYMGMLASPTWFLGLFFLLALPLPFNWAALSLADQSLIMPLFAATLLLNQILAPVFLKETLTCVDLVSTVTIIIGSTITVLCSNRAHHQPSVMTLTNLYIHPSFVLAELALLVCMAWAFWSIHKNLTASKWQMVQFAFLAGACGAQGNLALKSLGGLLLLPEVESGPAFNPWHWPGLYAFFLMVIGMSFMQLSFLNKGLARFDVVTYLPAYYAFLMGFGTIYGAIYYREFERYTLSELISFQCGCAIVLLGVLLLTQRKQRDECEDWKLTCKAIYYGQHEYRYLADGINVSVITGHATTPGGVAPVTSPLRPAGVSHLPSHQSTSSATAAATPSATDVGNDLL